MKLKAFGALAAASLLIQGCTTIGGRQRPSPQESHSVPSGPVAPVHRWTLDAEQQSLANASCYGGVPLDTNADAGPTELVIRRGYVLEHSSRDKLPLWVCESVAADQLTGHVVRRNTFKADPDLKGPKSFPNDYKSSGFDRGHQAPAGNQTQDPVLKDQTFYMSNMAPQRPSLNRGIWRVLEDMTRNWVMRYGHAYEWTGPILCVDRTPCKPLTIGPGVAVPEYFYKIILVRDQSQWKGVAFVLPNRDFSRPYHLERYIRSIDWIAQQTGIDFMPDTSEAVRRMQKSAVAPLWP